jgi:hypothetical protein
MLKRLASALTVSLGACRSRSRHRIFPAGSVFFPAGSVFAVSDYRAREARTATHLLFPCRVGNKAGGEDAYPTGSVFRLGARGQYCSAARLHLCFGSFAFGTVSLVYVVPCTHPGTFCPGPILFYSLHSCARGRYSSLPRFWAGRTILVSSPRSFYRSVTGEDQRIAFPGIRGTTLERKYLTLFHLARQTAA